MKLTQHRPYSNLGKVIAVCSARSLDTKVGGTTNRQECIK